LLFLSGYNYLSTYSRNKEYLNKEELAVFRAYISADLHTQLDTDRDEEEKEGRIL
jgi:hypothetical protein